MMCQVLFSTKKIRKISSICRLLNLPIAWLSVRGIRGTTRSFESYRLKRCFQYHGWFEELMMMMMMMMMMIMMTMKHKTST